MPRTLVCPGCSATCQSKAMERGGHTVGEVREETGWQIIMGMDGSTGWCCTPCFKKIVTLARKAARLTGMKYPSLGTLTRGKTYDQFELKDDATQTDKEA